MAQSKSQSLLAADWELRERVLKQLVLKQKSETLPTGSSAPAVLVPKPPPKGCRSAVLVVAPPTSVPSSSSTNFRSRRIFRHIETIGDPKQLLDEESKFRRTVEENEQRQRFSLLLQRMRASLSFNERCSVADAEALFRRLISDEQRFEFTLLPLHSEQVALEEREHRKRVIAQEAFAHERLLLFENFFSKELTARRHIEVDRDSAFKDNVVTWTSKRDELQFLDDLVSTKNQLISKEKRHRVSTKRFLLNEFGDVLAQTCTELLEPAIRQDISSNESESREKLLKQSRFEWALIAPPEVVPVKKDEEIEQASTRQLLQDEANKSKAIEEAYFDTAPLEQEEQNQRCSVLYEPEAKSFRSLVLQHHLSFTLADRQKVIDMERQHRFQLYCRIFEFQETCIRYMFEKICHSRMGSIHLKFVTGLESRVRRDVESLEMQQLELLYQFIKTPPPEKDKFQVLLTQEDEIREYITSDAELAFKLLQVSSKQSILRTHIEQHQDATRADLEVVFCRVKASQTNWETVMRTSHLQEEEQNTRDSLWLTYRSELSDLAELFASGGCRILADKSANILFGEEKSSRRREEAEENELRHALEADCAVKKANVEVIDKATYERTQMLQQLLGCKPQREKSAAQFLIEISPLLTPELRLTVGPSGVTLEPRLIEADENKTQTFIVFDGLRGYLSLQALFSTKACFLAKRETALVVQPEKSCFFQLAKANISSLASDLGNTQPSKDQAASPLFAPRAEFSHLPEISCVAFLQTDDALTLDPRDLQLRNSADTVCAFRFIPSRAAQLASQIDYECVQRRQILSSILERAKMPTSDPFHARSHPLEFISPRDQKRISLVSENGTLTFRLEDRTACTALQHALVSQVKTIISQSFEIRPANFGFVFLVATGTDFCLSSKSTARGFVAATKPGREEGAVWEMAQFEPGFCYCIVANTQTVLTTEQKEDKSSHHRLIFTSQPITSKEMCFVLATKSECDAIEQEKIVKARRALCIEWMLHQITEAPAELAVTDCLVIDAQKVPGSALIVVDRTESRGDAFFTFELINDQFYWKTSSGSYVTIVKGETMDELTLTSNVNGASSFDPVRLGNRVALSPQGMSGSFVALSETNDQKPNRLVIANQIAGDVISFRMQTKEEGEICSRFASASAIFGQDMFELSIIDVKQLAQWHGICCEDGQVCVGKRFTADASKFRFKAHVREADGFVELFHPDARTFLVTSESTPSVSFSTANDSRGAHWEVRKVGVVENAPLLHKVQLVSRIFPNHFVDIADDGTHRIILKNESLEVGGIAFAVVPSEMSESLLRVCSIQRCLRIDVLDLHVDITEQFELFPFNAPQKRLCWNSSSNEASLLVESPVRVGNPTLEGFVFHWKGHSADNELGLVRISTIIHDSRSMPSYLGVKNNALTLVNANQIDDDADQQQRVIWSIAAQKRASQHPTSGAPFRLVPVSCPELALCPFTGQLSPTAELMGAISLREANQQFIRESQRRDRLDMLATITVPRAPCELLLYPSTKAGLCYHPAAANSGVNAQIGSTASSNGLFVVNVTADGFVQIRCQFNTRLALTVHQSALSMYSEASPSTLSSLNVLEKLSNCCDFAECGNDTDPLFLWELHPGSNHQGEILLRSAANFCFVGENLMFVQQKLAVGFRFCDGEVAARVRATEGAIARRKELYAAVMQDLSPSDVEISLSKQPTMVLSAVWSSSGSSFVVEDQHSAACCFKFEQEPSEGFFSITHASSGLPISVSGDMITLGGPPSMWEFFREPFETPNALLLHLKDNEKLFHFPVVPGAAVLSTVASDGAKVCLRSFHGERAKAEQAKLLEERTARHAKFFNWANATPDESFEIREYPIAANTPLHLQRKFQFQSETLSLELAEADSNHPFKIREGANKYVIFEPLSTPQWELFPVHCDAKERDHDNNDVSFPFQMKALSSADPNAPSAEGTLKQVLCLARCSAVSRSRENQNIRTARFSLRTEMLSPLFGSCCSGQVEIIPVGKSLSLRARIQRQGNALVVLATRTGLESESFFVVPVDEGFIHLASASGKIGVDNSVGIESNILSLSPGTSDNEGFHWEIVSAPVPEPTDQESPSSKEDLPLGEPQTQVFLLKSRTQPSLALGVVDAEGNLGPVDVKAALGLRFVPSISAELASTNEKRLATRLERNAQFFQSEKGADWACEPHEICVYSKNFAAIHLFERLILEESNLSVSHAGIGTCFTFKQVSNGYVAIKVESEVPNRDKIYLALHNGFPAAMVMVPIEGTNEPPREFLWEIIPIRPAEENALYSPSIFPGGSFTIAPAMKPSLYLSSRASLINAIAFEEQRREFPFVLLSKSNAFKYRSEETQRKLRYSNAQKVLSGFQNVPAEFVIVETNPSLTPRDEKSSSSPFFPLEHFPRRLEAGPTDSIIATRREDAKSFSFKLEESGYVSIVCQKQNARVFFPFFTSESLDSNSDDLWEFVPCQHVAELEEDEDGAMAAKLLSLSCAFKLKSKVGSVDMPSSSIENLTLALAPHPICIDLLAKMQGIKARRLILASLFSKILSASSHREVAEDPVEIERRNEVELVTPNRGRLVASQQYTALRTIDSRGGSADECFTLTESSCLDGYVKILLSKRAGFRTKNPPCVRNEGGRAQLGVADDSIKDYWEIAIASDEHGMEVPGCYNVVPRACPTLAIGTHGLLMARESPSVRISIESSYQHAMEANQFSKALRRKAAFEELTSHIPSWKAEDVEVVVVGTSLRSESYPPRLAVNNEGRLYVSPARNRDPTERFRLIRVGEEGVFGIKNEGRWLQVGEKGTTLFASVGTDDSSLPVPVNCQWSLKRSSWTDSQTHLHVVFCLCPAAVVENAEEELFLGSDGALTQSRSPSVVLISALCSTRMADQFYEDMTKRQKNASILHKFCASGSFEIAVAKEASADLADPSFGRCYVEDNLFSHHNSRNTGSSELFSLVTPVVPQQRGWDHFFSRAVEVPPLSVSEVGFVMLQNKVNAEKFLTLSENQSIVHFEAKLPGDAQRRQHWEVRVADDAVESQIHPDISIPFTLLSRTQPSLALTPKGELVPYAEATKFVCVHPDPVDNAIAEKLAIKNRIAMLSFLKFDESTNLPRAEGFDPNDLFSQNYLSLKDPSLVCIAKHQPASLIFEKISGGNEDGMFSVRINETSFIGTSKSWPPSLRILENEPHPWFALQVNPTAFTLATLVIHNEKQSCWAISARTASLIYISESILQLQRLMFVAHSSQVHSGFASPILVEEFVRAEAETRAKELRESALASIFPGADSCIEICPEDSSVLRVTNVNGSVRLNSRYHPVRNAAQAAMQRFTIRALGRGYFAICTDLGDALTAQGDSTIVFLPFDEQCDSQFWSASNITPDSSEFPSEQSFCCGPKSDPTRVWNIIESCLESVDNISASSDCKIRLVLFEASSSFHRTTSAMSALPSSWVNDGPRTLLELTPSEGPLGNNGMTLRVCTFNAPNSIQQAPSLKLSERQANSTEQFDVVATADGFFTIQSGSLFLTASENNQICVKARSNQQNQEWEFIILSENSFAMHNREFPLSVTSSTPPSPFSLQSVEEVPEQSFKWITVDESNGLAMEAAFRHKRFVMLARIFQLETDDVKAADELPFELVEVCSMKQLDDRISLAEATTSPEGHAPKLTMAPRQGNETQEFILTNCGDGYISIESVVEGEFVFAIMEDTTDNSWKLLLEPAEPGALHQQFGLVPSTPNSCFCFIVPRVNTELLIILDENGNFTCQLFDERLTDRAKFGFLLKSNVDQGSLAMDENQIAIAGMSARRATHEAILGLHGLSSMEGGIGATFEIRSVLEPEHPQSSDSLSLRLGCRGGAEGYVEGSHILTVPRSSRIDALPAEPKGTFLNPPHFEVEPITDAHCQLFRFLDAGDGFLNLELCSAGEKKRLVAVSASHESLPLKLRNRNGLPSQQFALEFVTDHQSGGLNRRLSMVSISDFSDESLVRIVPQSHPTHVVVVRPRTFEVGLAPREEANAGKTRSATSDDGSVVQGEELWGVFSVLPRGKGPKFKANEASAHQVERHTSILRAFGVNLDEVELVCPTRENDAVVVNDSGKVVMAERTRTTFSAAKVYETERGYIAISPLASPGCVWTCADTGDFVSVAAPGGSENTNRGDVNPEMLSSAQLFEVEVVERKGTARVCFRLKPLSHRSFAVEVAEDFEGATIIQLSPLVTLDEDASVFYAMSKQEAEDMISAREAEVKEQENAARDERVGTFALCKQLCSEPQTEKRATVQMAPMDASMLRLKHKGKSIIAVEQTFATSENFLLACSPDGYIHIHPVDRPGKVISHSVDNQSIEVVDFSDENVSDETFFEMILAGDETSADLCVQFFPKGNRSYVMELAMDEDPMRLILVETISETFSRFILFRAK